MAAEADPNSFDTDVVILGTGPVGTLLAIVLGQRGKRVTLVARWSTHCELPRAVTYDHEMARILATLGMDSENDPAISYHGALYYWMNRDRQNPSIVDWQSQSASGWQVRYWFNQPMMENRFMAIAAQQPSVTILRGWVGKTMEQDAQSVSLTIQRTPEEVGPDGGTRVIRAQFLAGTDGANSFVRRSLGIENEDRGDFFDWLILDMIMGHDYVAARAPEPAQWQLCDPARPTTIVPGGLGPDPKGPPRRRWEYMLLPGASVEGMQTPEKAWKLLAPWGVTPDNASLERSAVCRFQARWAKGWNKGRCMIGGDAAHLMPPFAGKGMCAGVRDAVAMAWRLNGILEGKFGNEVLDSYTSERIEHAKHYINFSQELGQIICIADEKVAAERDARMIADLAARGGKPVLTDICHLRPSAWCDESAHASELSVQGIVDSGGQRGRFDQMVGQGRVLIGYEADPAAALTKAQRAELAQLEGMTMQLCAPGGACDVVDSEGTFAAWLDGIGAKYVRIRPDFHVALTARVKASLRSRFDKVISALHLVAQPAMAAE